MAREVPTECPECGAPVIHDAQRGIWYCSVGHAVDWSDHGVVRWKAAAKEVVA